MEDQPNIYAEYKAKRWQEIQTLSSLSGISGYSGLSAGNSGRFVSEIDRLHAVIEQEAANYKALQKRLELLTGRGVGRLIFGQARKAVQFIRYYRDFFLKASEKTT